MDLRTNLVWQQTDDGVQYDLAGAKAHCASLALGGVGAGGWRLPTAIELLTLVDDTKASPAINTKIFPGTQSGLYWSSTTDGYGRVWYVDFASGSDATLGVGSTFTPFARCVH
jgi:hypothetical protein